MTVVNIYLVTSFLMLAAPGWPGSSPLATRLLSSLCLSKMATLAAALSSRNSVLAAQSEEGPWHGDSQSRKSY